VKYVILALVALAVFGLGYIRLAPDDVAQWHVDPQTVKRGPKPNQFVLRDGDGDAESPVFDMSADDLAQVFDDYALSRPRVTRLAGDPQQLWVTYIQRSKWFGFPDYISVRALPAEAGRSALVIYSRARYGGSDLGVNEARIAKWIDGLRRILADRPAAAEQL
jgi:uncharacterized protein (DUF1499 family)